jgi:hypothetical protein
VTVAQIATLERPKLLIYNHPDVLEPNWPGVKRMLAFAARCFLWHQLAMERVVVRKTAEGRSVHVYTDCRTGANRAKGGYPCFCR